MDKQFIQAKSLLALSTSAAQFIERINNVQKSGLPWIVALNGNSVVGYAYATKWKARSAYCFA
jgi:L-amino acid N-acyltransferase YncA